IPPSRSLRVDDELSLNAMKWLTPERVLEATGFKEYPVIPQSREEAEPMRPCIAFVGQNEALFKFLSDFCFVEKMEFEPRGGSVHDYDAILIVSEQGCTIVKRTKRFSVDVGDFQNVQRALRELSGA